MALEGASVDGDGDESQEEEEQVAQRALPIGGHGDGGEPAGDGVHLVSGAHENERRDEQVERRVAGHEDEHPVRVGRQPDVVLTCARR